MYRAVLDVVKNEEICSDIVHDTMIKLINNSKTIRIDGSFPLKTYVAVAAKNAAIDYLRVNGKKDSMATEDLSSRWDIEDDSAAVIDVVVGNDQYDKLVQFIRELPDTYKNVCYLKYVCDLDEREIAAVLDITYANAAIRVHRGRKLLQEKIAEVQKNEK